MTDFLQQQFAQGLTQLDLSLSSQQQQRCLDYLHLLHKWNRAYNLSAVRELNDMLPRHLLDSLSIAPYVDAQTCLDVGSGGGLPGIPLAIAFPDRQFTLLDSNGKKTRFLFQAVTELGLQNVTVEQSRVEEKSAPPKFAGIVSRAFSTINAMLDSCAQLLAEHGKVYAMKGQHPAAELADLNPAFAIEAIHRLAVPSTPGARHLVVLHKA